MADSVPPLASSPAVVPPPPSQQQANNAMLMTEVNMLMQQPEVIPVLPPLPPQPAEQIILSQQELLVNNTPQIPVSCLNPTRFICVYLCYFYINKERV